MSSCPAIPIAWCCMATQVKKTYKANTIQLFCGFLEGGISANADTNYTKNSSSNFWGVGMDGKTLLYDCVNSWNFLT